MDDAAGVDDFRGLRSGQRSRFVRAGSLFGPQRAAREAQIFASHVVHDRLKPLPSRLSSSARRQLWSARRSFKPQSCQHIRHRKLGQHTEKVSFSIRSRHDRRGSMAATGESRKWWSSEWEASTPFSLPHRPRAVDTNSGNLRYPSGKPLRETPSRCSH